MGPPHPSGWDRGVLVRGRRWWLPGSPVVTQPYPGADRNNPPSPRAPSSWSFVARRDPLGPRSLARWRVNRLLRMESLSSVLAPAQQPVGTTAPCCPCIPPARHHGVSPTGTRHPHRHVPPPWGAVQGARCCSPLPTQTQWSSAPAAQAFPLLLRLRPKPHETGWGKSSATRSGARWGPRHRAGSQ